MNLLPARLLLAMLGVLCGMTPVGAQAPTEKALERTWLDADGKPLPFRTDDELIEFMRVAPIVRETTIAAGIMHSKKVLLEKDGIRIHSIFREADIRTINKRVGDRMYLRFADSCLFEAAAYKLAKLLGLYNVPPVVIRTIKRRKGTLQIWVEDTLDIKSEDFKPPSAADWVRQFWDMYLFDNLVFNVDRNKGNLLVDNNYKLWMIDHTRAFQAVSALLEPEKIVRVNRAMWERLSSLTEEDLRGAVSDCLEGPEILSLMVRRRLLLEHVEKLVNRRGEKLVFY